LYGEDHIYSHNVLGSEESLEEITLEDLKAFYEAAVSPHLAKFHTVGFVSQDQVVTSLERIASDWERSELEIPEYKTPENLTTSTIYFYDVPGAKQSVLRFGYLALPAGHEDYYPATVMNYRLGGGGFASILTQELREGKGYTYGIRSSFSGSEETGTFTITSGVRSNVTYESTQLIKELVSNYGEQFDEEDLEVTKDFMLKSSARAFETLGAKLGMVQNISNYGWEEDYVTERQAFVKQLSIEEVKSLISEYIRPGQMHFLIVGDAATQLEGLKKLGLGDPVILN
ncbi:MAG: insulinase family protein, partial [Cyclobacteriaceae bacterium]